jgi:hypothetical protein
MEDLNVTDYELFKLDSKELQEISGGLHPLTKGFLWLIGYHGGEVAWAAEQGANTAMFMNMK